MKKEITVKEGVSLIALTMPAGIADFELFQHPDGRVGVTYFAPGVEDKVSQDVTDKRLLGRFDAIGTVSDVDHIDEYGLTSSILRKLLRLNGFDVKAWHQRPVYKTKKEAMDSVNAPGLLQHYFTQIESYDKLNDDLLLVVRVQA